MMKRAGHLKHWDRAWYEQRSIENNPVRQGLACGAVSSLDGVVDATFVGDGHPQSGGGWLRRAASRLVPFVAAVYMFAACSPGAAPSPVPASTRDGIVVSLNVP